MLQVLVVKLLITFLLTGAIGLVFAYKTSIQALATAYPRAGFLLFWLILRLIPFLLIYVAFGEKAHSDVGIFYDSAKGARAWGVVYRDFDSAYQPLFAYLTALPLFFWDSAEAILLEMILVEGIILWFTYRYYQAGQPNALFIALLYLLLPAPFVLVVLSGQEDIWMWGFGIWAMWQMRRKPDGLRLGLIVGLSLLVTKVVIVLLLPALFIFVRDRWRFVLGLVLIGVPALGLLYASGEMAFMSIIHQADAPRTPNLWSIANPFLSVYRGVGVPLLNGLGLLSTVLISVLVAVFSGRKDYAFGQFFPLLWCVTFAWFMCIQQSSLANYAFIFLMPLLFGVFSIQNRTALVLLLLFNAAIVIQPVLWWGMGMPVFSASDFVRVLPITEYVLELIIVGLLLYFIWNVLRARLSGISQRHG
ncbi:MAG: hypothetical protein LH606_17050 [Cytophagaceae bacterium]|nr:hypothetical protein [Cytophagaceae bacterium]